MGLPETGVFQFQSFQITECRFPLPLKLSCDEAVFRLNGLVLSTGTLSHLGISG